MKRLLPSAEAPLRVLHVIAGLGMGGAETWLLELMRHWQKVGNPVVLDILLTGGVQDLFDDEARSLGAQLHYVRYATFTACPRSCASFARFSPTSDMTRSTTMATTAPVGAS